MAEGLQSAIDAAQNLDLSIDELDEKEFDLPPVDNPPTLESILNEPEDDASAAFEEESIHSDSLLQGDGSDTVSMTSQEGILGDGKPKKKNRKNIHYEQHGSILRHVILKGVSAQILSAVDRVDAGMPSALAVSSLIAVGTSHGLVLVFDPKQVLKCCLGGTAVGAQYGAVSALSFNRDCSRLLCGFAKGQMTMWDITNGKLLRTITDAHPPGTAILHIKFTDDLTLAVCSDSGGSVFELEFKRLIGVRTCESRCLFSGSRGEVCAIEPLHMNHTIQDHPMRDVIVLAMASLSKVLIVTLRPQLKVMFTHVLKGDPSTLPLLAWQFVVIQVSEKDRVVDPVLAFARDQTIYFYQIVCNSPEDVKFAALQKTELPYKLLALTWMNPRTMVAIDTSEKAHVIDVRSEEELEVIDLVEVQLIYSTSFYKSLATGGNVSKALAYAGERACYHSLVSYNGQLVLLGTKGIHVMTMRNWVERIDVLVRQERYQEALTLGLSFYEGKAKAVVGLVGGSSKRKRLVADKMLDLLDQYVDLTMTVGCPERGTLEVLEEYYQGVVPICVKHCLILDRLDMLFGKIYDQFSEDPIAKGVFLECLEPYIIRDELTSITPSVMKDFVNHYTEKGMLQNVEACIVHLDIASLDIHQVVSLCWANALYDAILYVYNKGMLDYTTPLEELFVILREAISTGKQFTDDQIKLGNKLLVYISCCLAGRAYPLGDIPPEQEERVKNDVFKCVTCLHTKNAKEDEPAYPHLRALLQFDTREFFNVLSLAFEEPEFSTEDGIEKRQRLVDILLQVMVESIGFTPMQVGILFTFLARQMARHDSIFVNRVLFEQVLESLANPNDTSRHEERQQALIELLNAGGLNHYNEAKLLKLAESAQFYQVCELLYERRREFDKILACYLKDPNRKEQSFAYIESIEMSSNYTDEEKEAVEKFAMASIKTLVEIDSQKTAQLVLVAFSHSLSEVISLLKGEDKSLYDFLSGVFEYRESSGSAIYSDGQINIEPSIHELYIDLMCVQHPHLICSYLKASDGYRNEEALQICQKHDVYDATAYLLEITGEVQEAFNILHNVLQNKLTDFTAVLLSNELQPEDELVKSWSSIQLLLIDVTQLCQRNSGKLEEADRQALWFPLLETLMGAQKIVKDSNDKRFDEALKQQTSQMLNSMMGYIALPAILQKIMQDPSYNTGKFGDIRELILGMLDTYNYEKTLLKTCNNLVNHDLHLHLACLTQEARRGIVMPREMCCLCNKPLMTNNDNVISITFRCGHGFHVACIRATGSCQVIGGEESWLCFLCNKSQRGRIRPTTRVRLPSSASEPGPVRTSTASGKPGLTKKDKKEKEVILDPEQVQAIDSLRRIQKTQSRLAILAELAKPDSTHKWKSSSPSILQNELFQLRLAPPPPNTEVNEPRPITFAESKNQKVYETPDLDMDLHVGMRSYEELNPYESLDIDIGDNINIQFQAPDVNPYGSPSRKMNDNINSQSHQPSVGMSHGSPSRKPTYEPPPSGKPTYDMPAGRKMTYESPPGRKPTIEQSPSRKPTYEPPPKRNQPPEQPVVRNPPAARHPPPQEAPIGRKPVANPPPSQRSAHPAQAPRKPEPRPAKSPAAASTNPFGDDTESTNPFGDDGDDYDESLNPFAD